MDNKKRESDKCHEVSKLNTQTNKRHNDKSQLKQKTTGKQADPKCYKILYANVDSLLNKRDELENQWWKTSYSLFDRSGTKKQENTVIEILNLHKRLWL